MAEDTVVIDPVASAARFLAEGLRAVPPAPESPAPTSDAPGASTDGEEATKGEQVDAAAESPETGATKAKEADGTAKESGTLEASLRAAVEKDPALALVPEVRERLGLPPIGKTESAKEANAPLTFDTIPNDEEFQAAYRKKYDEKMTAGDDIGAIEAVAQAHAQRAGKAAAEAAVNYMLTMARDGQLVDEFVEGHPEFGTKRQEVYSRIQDLRKKANVGALSNQQVLTLLDPRPSKSDAAKVLAQAAADAAKKKTTAAASAAAAPTNQRPAGAPTAQKPKTALDSAREKLDSAAAANTKATQLYAPGALTRRSA